MYTGIYEMAEKVIEVHSLYGEIHEYCKDYAAEKTPDFTVTTSQADIDAEREKSMREDIAGGKAVRNFPDAYLEELAVYRKIAEKMPEYDTVLFHGSVIAVEGVGYLFTAKSGTGKSTHTKLWRELLGEKAVMVNDDKPLIRITEEGVTVFGTPYNGKHRLGSRISVPLRALCILTRAEENTITRITKSQAYPMLLQQVYRPLETAQMAKTLALVDRLAENVYLYRLRCNMELEAAEIAYHGMKG